MMGERNPQAALWSYRVNLDKRVRRDRPLRRIDAVLDPALRVSKSLTAMVAEATNLCCRMSSCE
jgi:hypothetical protein